ncbi:MAG: dihydrofolate reductase family protein [Nanopusillaceae archaeon]
MKIIGLVGISIDGKLNFPKDKGRSRIFDIIAESEPILIDLKNKLRKNVDAIMVGSRTVLIDNPRLYVPEKKVYRIIIDRSLKLEKKISKLKIFNIFPERTIIVTTSNNSRKIKRIKSTGCDVVRFRNTEECKFFKSLLKYLRKVYKINKILVEGGGSLIYRLLKCKLIDKLYLVIFPIIIGDKKAVSLVQGEGFNKFLKGKIKKVKVTRRGFLIIEFVPLYY